MASIWEKAISILAGYLNSGRSYIITAYYVQASTKFLSTLEYFDEKSDKNTIQESLGG